MKIFILLSSSFIVWFVMQNSKPVQRMQILYTLNDECSATGNLLVLVWGDIQATTGKLHVWSQNGLPVHNTFSFRHFLASEYVVWKGCENSQATSRLLSTSAVDAQTWNIANLDFDFVNRLQTEYYNKQTLRKSAKLKVKAVRSLSSMIELLK